MEWNKVLRKLENEAKKDTRCPISIFLSNVHTAFGNQCGRRDGTTVVDVAEVALTASMRECV